MRIIHACSYDTVTNVQGMHELSRGDSNDTLKVINRKNNIEK